jgi:hypothetical protein
VAAQWRCENPLPLSAFGKLENYSRKRQYEQRKKQTCSIFEKFQMVARLLLAFRRTVTSVGLAEDATSVA